MGHGPLAKGLFVEVGIGPLGKVEFGCNPLGGVGDVCAAGVRALKATQICVADRWTAAYGRASVVLLMLR